MGNRHPSPHQANRRTAHVQPGAGNAASVGEIGRVPVKRQPDRGLCIDGPVPAEPQKGVQGPQLRGLRNRRRHQPGRAVCYDGRHGRVCVLLRLEEHQDAAQVHGERRASHVCTVAPPGDEQGRHGRVGWSNQVLGLNGVFILFLYVCPFFSAQAKIAEDFPTIVS